MCYLHIFFLILQLKFFFKRRFMQYWISSRSFFTKLRSQKPLLERRYIVDCKATLVAFLHAAAARMHNIARIVRAAIIVAVMNLRRAPHRVFEKSEFFQLWPIRYLVARGPPGYPEKCTHRYCADTKVVLRPKPASRLSASNCYCRTIDFWFRRRRLSRKSSLEGDFSSPSNLMFHPSFNSFPFRSFLFPLLISHQYCAPLFRIFCPHRIARVIDKTSKSVAHASNKIDSPSFYCLRYFP